MGSGARVLRVACSGSGKPRAPTRGLQALQQLDAPLKKEDLQSCK